MNVVKIFSYLKKINLFYGFSIGNNYQLLLWLNVSLQGYSDYLITHFIIQLGMVVRKKKSHLREISQFETFGHFGSSLHISSLLYHWLYNQKKA